MRIINYGHDASSPAIAVDRLAALTLEAWRHGDDELYKPMLAEYIDQVVDADRPDDWIGQLLADAASMIGWAVTRAAYEASDPALRDLPDHDLTPEFEHILDDLTARARARPDSL